MHADVSSQASEGVAFVLANCAHERFYAVMALHVFMSSRRAWADYTADRTFPTVCRHLTLMWIQLVPVNDHLQMIIVIRRQTFIITVYRTKITAQHAQNHRRSDHGG